ncbi:type II toxin-antitoxin system RelE/ParE family toxin [Salinarimonas rosea]|uniref:type II toxin-antitoxin system RelE/ParE family toxin n=1 Tax=Salinarimonas rosea TaxID=552063 RepID=UPI0003F9B3E2|nr:type II toxin-antitoxin system RelE/ParE family toxin [Salinarimonas rosea]
MRIFKTKEFARLARKARLTDGDLRGVIRRAEAGQIDARIGKFLIKQRVASESKGKAKAYRTIVCHMIGTRAVFLDLFSKSETASLTKLETEAYRDAAKEMAALSNETVDRLMDELEWIEIDNDEDLSE